MLKVKAVGNRLLDLMADSTLTSATLAVGLTGTACYMWASGMAVPDQLYALLYGVVGFFFMSKATRNGRIG